MNPDKEEWTPQDDGQCRIAIFVTSLLWALDFVAAKFVLTDLWVAYACVGGYMFFITMAHSLAQTWRWKPPHPPGALKALNLAIFSLQSVMLCYAIKWIPGILILPYLFVGTMGVMACVGCVFMQLDDKTG